MFSPPPVRRFAPRILDGASKNPSPNLGKQSRSGTSVAIEYQVVEW